MGLLINPGEYKSPLLQKQKMKVADRGDLVILTIGSTEITLPYEAALDISALLRLHAKRAKATAGDSSRNWRVLGILADASKAGG